MTQIINETNKLVKNTGSRAREMKDIRKELKQIARQQDKLTDLLVQVRNQRPYIEKIDALEDRKTELERRLEEIRPAEGEKLDADKRILGDFLAEYRNSVKAADSDGKKALLRGFVDHMKLVDDKVHIITALQGQTGVKRTSPIEKDSNRRQDQPSNWVALKF